HPTAGTTATTASTPAPPCRARSDGSGEDHADAKPHAFPGTRGDRPARSGPDHGPLPRARPHRARLGTVPPRRAPGRRPASRQGPVLVVDGELAAAPARPA